MELIPDWKRKIHKLWTSRLAFAGSVLGIASETLPNLQEYLPPNWYIFLFVGILVARVVSQPAAHEPT